MSIKVNELLHYCKKEMQSVEQNAGFTDIVRKPNRPLMIVFLGEHRSECIAEVKQTIETNWPQHSHAILYRYYLEPESFRKAMEEDKEGNIALEDDMIEQCNINRGFEKCNDIIIIYFVNLSQCSEEFIEILNEPFNPPAVGVITRFLLTISGFSRNAERAKVISALNRINELAKTPEYTKVWNHTHVLVLSNLMMEGTLPYDEVPNSYAVATELIIIYNSVVIDSGGVPILPHVTDEHDSFITGAFNRIGKPRDDINRTILYQYLLRCQQLIEAHNAENPGQGEDPATMLNECAKLIQRLFHEKVKPILPQESDLKGLPFGVSSPMEAGEGGTEDKTCGIWKAYKRLYFEDAVKNAVGDIEQLVEYFQNSLSDIYSCAQITQRFGQLQSEIRSNNQFITPHIPEQGKGLIEYGKAAASEAMIASMVPALEEAIDRLLDSAKDYQDALNHVKAQLQPGSQSVANFYMKEVNQYLDSLSKDDEVIREMKRPCKEDDLAGHLEKVYKLILNNRNALRYSFEQELAERTDARNVTQQIESVLNITEGQMQKMIQMKLWSIGFKIGDYALVNPKADYAKHAEVNSKMFAVSRTDCLDRVAFYAFDVNGILKGNEER